MPILNPDITVFLADIGYLVKLLPSKHLDVVSTLSFGWFQRWFEQRQATSKQPFHFQCRFWQRWATSKQRCEYDHLKKE